MAKKKREGLSRSKRFMVFDRDDFTCSYCGRKPPVAVLEVDHVIPVSSGGSNDEGNLLTSCFDCNRGKGAKPLGATPPVDYRRLGDETKERAEQLAAYQDHLARLHEQRVRMVDMVGEAYWSFQGPRLTWRRDEAARERSQVYGFIERIGLEETIESAQVSSDAVARGTVRFSNQWRYFCGCVWKRARGEQ